MYIHDKKKMKTSLMAVLYPDHINMFWTKNTKKYGRNCNNFGGKSLVKVPLKLYKAHTLIADSTPIIVKCFSH